MQMSVTDAAVSSQGVVLSAYRMKPTTTDNEYMYPDMKPTTTDGEYMSLDMKTTATDNEYSYPAMQSECEATVAV